VEGVDEAILAELINTFTLVLVGTATAVLAGSGTLARNIHETGEIASGRRGLTGSQ
jgi:hypothetical protein